MKIRFKTKDNVVGIKECYDIDPPVTVVMSPMWSLKTGLKAVIIRFAKAVDWIGLDRDSALYLADLLIRRAADLPKTKPTNER